ncbi:MAG TPA: hypothetical protein VGG84_16105 [Gemmatimonadaceae bacterium]
MHQPARAFSRVCLALGLIAAGACATGHGNSFVPPSRPAEFSLTGIPWGISADSVTELMSPRGYNYNKTDDDGDLWYDGVLYRTATRVYAFMGQQKLTKFRMVINTPDEEAVATYQKVRAELIRQYGQPKETVEEYEPPYTKGDARLINAFKEKKAAMRTYWLPTGTRTSLVAVAVSNNLAVVVDYETTAWDKESVRRRQHGR